MSRESVLGSDECVIGGIELNHEFWLGLASYMCICVADEGTIAQQCRMSYAEEQSKMKTLVRQVHGWIFTPP